MSDVDGTNARVLIEDGPPQALKYLTEVRITAIVQSDKRVTYEAPKQDTAASSQTITDTIRKKTFRWVQRHSSSAYSNEGTGVIRNDAAADGSMAELASKLRKHTEPMGQGVSLTIPWLDFSYRLGERVSEISGRGVGLASRAGEEPSFPTIGQVTYDFRSQRTGLWLRPPARRR